MPQQTIQDRLNAALQTRSKLQDQRSRLQGKLDAARQELTKLTADCKSKNIDPEKLSELIRGLEARLEQKLGEYEAALRDLEQKLSQYQ